MLEQLDLTQLIFGRLSWDAIPLHEPVIVATFVVVAIGGVALLGALTYYRVWGYLWKEWFTSIDHKKIGIMYMVLGLVMLLRGFAAAIMMRIQQAWAFGDATGYLPPDHHDLLRRHAADHRHHELHHSVADRRPGCGLPVSQ